MSEYQQGREAKRSGVNSLTNPYDNGTEEYSRWQEGYADENQGNIWSQQEFLHNIRNVWI